MSSLSGPIYGIRTGKPRDRRGRGMRGPMSLPGPLSPRGVPADQDRAAEFNSYVLAALNSMSSAIKTSGTEIEVAVEAAPLLPDNWDDTVPASTLTSRGSAHTIVIYRLPITQRAQSSNEVLALVWEVLSHRVAEVLGTHPDDLLDDF